MNPYYAMLEQQGFVPPSRFETTIKLICSAAAFFAVCWAKAWAALWLCPIVIVLTTATERFKHVYWTGFDPFIQRGAERGDFMRLLFWNGLTVVLDWIFCCVAPVAGAFLLDAFTADKPIAPIFKWLYFFTCLYPPCMYPMKKGNLEARLFLIVLRWLPVVPIALSFFLPVSGLWVLCLYSLALFPTVGYSIYMKLPGWMRDFDKWYDAAKAGVFDVPVERKKRWRPREGVLFEPNADSSYLVGDPAMKEMYRKTLTILRVNWFGCIASFVMLIGGVVLTCVSASSAWLFLALPCILFGLMVGLAVSDLDRKRKRDEYETRAAVMLIVHALAGVIVLWMGGHDLMRLVAAALLMASSFMFFTGFIVRETSEGVNDTLDFVALVLGLAAVIVCRQGLGCLGWESLLPLVVSAGAPGLIRMRWPRRDLPFVVKQEPILLDYKKEQKARRERKRERQIAALRRSQRR